MGFGFGEAMLGLGGISDIFGAYSAMQQQQQQRDLYKRQMDLQSRLSNPAAMVAGAQPYTDYLNKNLATQIPNIMRSTVAPQLGMSGIDPGGGQGRLILDQALAPYYAGNAQTGLQQYQNALMGASGVGGTATNNVGAQFGGSGGTMDAMKTMMLMRALGGGGGMGGGMGMGGGGYDPVFSGTGNPASGFNQSQSLNYLQPQSAGNAQDFSKMNFF